MVRRLVIAGAGGFAREVAWLVRDINRAGGDWDLVGFWGHPGVDECRNIGGVPVKQTGEIAQYLPELYVAVAIGDPRAKERAVGQAGDLGCRFATLIHPSVRHDDRSVTIGSGSIVCAGTVLTVDVKVGAHVIVNLGCTVGHDSVIEDLVTLSPGCHLSGRTTVCRGAFMGTGAVTIEKRTIGAGATVGAGAVVVNDVPPGATAIGVPARVKDEATAPRKQQK
ncbi:MAG: NeuD/PglB/VioB family sugar acetyltransferase [Actinomycetota bacterium]